MIKMTTRKLTLAGLFIALGLLMPFFIGQIPNLGQRLLPMHIPVLICGYVTGWPVGLVVGFITPLLRSVLFGMPPMYPNAVVMAFELAAYGFATGLFNKILPKKIGFTYVTLIISMLCGRIVWGLVSYILYTFGDSPFTFQLFMAGAFINALPGIILQLVVIPAIVIALRKARLVEE